MGDPRAPIPAAVLVEQFSIKVTPAALFVCLFGLGIAKPGGQLEEIPVFTALMDPLKASEFAGLLAKAVNAALTLTADPERPQ